ncbi:hypothetical protein ABZ532_13185 [Streptomyces sp. NPDC019396]|uniref:hypothetical protein n=1 Tax=Streptomyces sp. NPDC019396 TaxID=3154687 RepID=UPI0033F2D201
MGKQRPSRDPNPGSDELGTAQHDELTTAQHKDGRLDLSVPQVAGSTLAAIAAAVLASRLGVYGTVIGAGVVSAVATCGGTVLQHLFRRTGEQIRDAAVQAGPGPGRSPRPPYEVRPEGEFGEPTVHGSRLRGWKRPLSAAVVVFAVAMVGITGYEVATGRELGGGTGTTLGSVVSGGGVGEGGAGDGTSPAGGTEQREHGPSPSRDPGDGTGPGAGGRQGQQGEDGDSRPAPDRDAGSVPPSPSPTPSSSDSPPDGDGFSPPPGGPSADGSGDPEAS